LDSAHLAPRKGAREHGGIVIKAVQIVSPAAEFFNLERSLGARISSRRFFLCSASKETEKKAGKRVRGEARLILPFCHRRRRHV